MISRKRFRVHARALTRVRRIDGDGVHERIASADVLERLKERVIAGGVGAIRDDDHRRTHVIPLLEEFRGARERVVDRGSAGWLQRRERIPRPRRRHRPGRSQTRPVIERGDERLVLTEQQLTDESIYGAARVNDRLATHAVAGIEEHAEADRDARVSELRDVLRVAVLEDLEVFSGQPRDQTALRVGDRYGDLDDVDARAEATVPPRRARTARRSRRATKNTGTHTVTADRSAALARTTNPANSV